MVSSGTSSCHFHSESCGQPSQQETVGNVVQPCVQEGSLLHESLVSSAELAFYFISWSATLFPVSLPLSVQTPFISQVTGVNAFPRSFSRDCFLCV